MRYLYWILFGYSVIGMIVLALSLRFDFAWYVGFLFRMSFARFTDKKIVPFIVRMILKNSKIKINISNKK